jgi:hypothetical protein
MDKSVTLSVEELKKLRDVRDLDKGVELTHV